MSLYSINSNNNNSPTPINPPQYHPRIHTHCMLMVYCGEFFCVISNSFFFYNIMGGSTTSTSLSFNHLRPIRRADIKILHYVFLMCNFPKPDISLATNNLQQHKHAIFQRKTLIINNRFYTFPTHPYCIFSAIMD